MEGVQKTTIYYNHNFYYDFAGVISADDRGMQFGDGVYEWIRIHNGRPFALSYHVDRLYRSMRLLGIRATVAPDEFTEIHEVIADENDIREGYCMIVVTRGTGDHDFWIPERRELTPNVLVYAKPLDTASVEAVQSGVACVTMEDRRGPLREVLSLNQLPNLMARTEARKKKAYDGIFFREGELTEGTCSGIGIVKGGVIWAPPHHEHMIRSVTRSLVFSRVAPTAGVTAIEGKVDRDTFDGADEIFLTNSRDGVIPVLTVDGQPVGNGQVGDVTKKLQEHYAHLLDDGLP